MQQPTIQSMIVPLVFMMEFSTMLRTFKEIALIQICVENESIFLKLKVEILY